MAQHVQVQRGVVRLHGKPAAAHGNDVTPGAAHARYFWGAGKLLAAGHITLVLHARQQTGPCRKSPLLAARPVRCAPALAHRG